MEPFGREKGKKEPADSLICLAPITCTYLTSQVCEARLILITHWPFVHCHGRSFLISFWVICQMSNTSRRKITPKCCSYVEDLRMRGGTFTDLLTLFVIQTVKLSYSRTVEHLFISFIFFNFYLFFSFGITNGMGEAIS